MPRILIVDDDVMMTNLIKTLLTIEGHEAIAVNDSTTAMDVADTACPDLITLDLMMPGLTGLELCELLRQDPRFANIPILIVSASDDLENRAKTKAAGARDYLIKPFAVDELIQKISELTGS